MSISSPTRFSSVSSNFSGKTHAKRPETIRFGSGASAAAGAAGAAADAASGSSASSGAAIAAITVASVVGVIVVGLVGFCCGKPIVKALGRGGKALINMPGNQFRKLSNRLNAPRVDEENALPLENGASWANRESVQRPKQAIIH